MKVIFLDVDGVLNSDEYFDRIEKLNEYGILREIDIDKLLLVKRLVLETDAKIILTSSWRYTKNGTLLRALLQDYGIDTDLTPQINNNRGEEIRKWLMENKVEDYVIVDDEVHSTFDKDNLDRLIKISNGNGINFGEGLQEKDVEEIIKRLGKSKTLKKR